MEGLIRRAPAQYLWTFRWFKTRADGAPNPYKTRPGDGVDAAGEGDHGRDNGDRGRGGDRDRDHDGDGDHDRNRATTP